MNINKAFFFLFSFFTFHFPFSFFFSSFFFNGPFYYISVTVRCSRQQPLTAVGLSQRGVREAGQGGSGAGPILKSTAAASLLLLFCCANSRSLACSLALQRSGGRTRRRTRTSIWTKNEREKLHQSFFLLARSLLFSCSENSNPCKSFFFFFWWRGGGGGVIFSSLGERLVCLCLCVLLDWSDLLFSGLRFVVAGFESLRIITCLIFCWIAGAFCEESIWLIFLSVDYPYYHNLLLLCVVCAYACACEIFFSSSSSSSSSPLTFGWTFCGGVGKQ